MKALIQRVSSASVSVDGSTIGEITKGLVILLGVEAGDDERKTARMAQRLASYRVFSDDRGKMNLSVGDIAGDVLVVSQFTLVADTSRGLRPGFSKAASPALAEELYQLLITTLRQQPLTVATGRFAADMAVTLVNDGPVTFMLET